MAIGDTLSGAIESPGRADVYTFTATAGQVVLVDAQQGSFFDFDWSLTGPSGTVRPFGFFDDVQVTLPDTGTYTLRVDPNDDATGAYRMQLVAI